MRVIIQRVSRASISFAQNPEKIVCSIGKGYVILVGIHTRDTECDIAELVPKILNIKLFSDASGNHTGLEEKSNQKSRWKRSIIDEEGEIVLASQFTLYAIAGKKGRAPDFHNAMNADDAKILFEKFAHECKKAYGADKIFTGVFQEHTLISLTNDGPVTITIESTSYLKEAGALLK
ncbi:D-tyrosyl-tRNA(Tyr) deacylase [Mitosporidium daphniae]